MQDLDSAQIHSNQPKSDHFFPNFASTLPKFNQISPQYCSNPINLAQI